jgi:CubicO group peptidase (beta-lactamase class C family)
MKRLLAAGLLASVVALAATVSATQGTAPRLDALLTGLHQRGLFDGAVVVGEGATVVFAKGYGLANAEQRVSFTPDTAADGASLAKTFTAALLLQLQSENRIDLDAPAQRYLRELPYADISLRHLLSHTSGIPVEDYDYFDPFLPRDAIRTTDALLSVLAAQKPVLASKPGTVFSYSSFGFDLAALAASRVAGATYEQLLRDRFFRPLDISSAFVRPGRLSDFPSVRSIGYRRIMGALEPNEVFDLEAFHGGSNVYISARDLHRWNASFLNHPLLEARALAALLAPAKVGGKPSGLTLGSWYFTTGGDAFWYSGHLQGFHSEVFRRMPAKRSIVYVSNNTIDPWLQKGLVRAIEKVLSGREPGTIDPPVFEAVAADARASLAGEWRMTDGTRWTIESRPRFAISRGGVSYPIFPVGQAFYAPGLDLIIGFNKGADGSLTRIQVSSNVEEQPGHRER